MLNQKTASGVADGPAMTRGKTLLLSLLTSVVSLVLFLSVAEIVLRFLPVSSALQSRVVNSGQPIFHFRPNRNFVNSHGWTMHSVTRHRINNAGFVNDQETDVLYFLEILERGWIIPVSALPDRGRSVNKWHKTQTRKSMATPSLRPLSSPYF